MKNVCKVICLSFILLIISALTVCADESDAHVPLKRETEKQCLSTPYSEVMLMSAVSEEDALVSAQILGNITKVPSDVFLMTDEGIKTINPWKAMTDEELECVKAFSYELTKDCEDADDIIRTASLYVAQNVCYDYDYVEGRKAYEDLYFSPYDVLLHGSSVCYGYATALNAILQINSIPCTLVLSPDHAWSMAYNGERWILVDTTWMSNGYMLDGVLYKSPEVREEWYDFSTDKALSDVSHIILYADYMEYDDTIWAFPIYTSCKEFEIPKNVTGVDDKVFMDLSEIKFTFNGSFESVGMGAFSGCNNFDGVLNLKNIKELEELAFRGCQSIDAVYIGGGIETVPLGAFFECYSLRKIHLDKNVKAIEDYAFAMCTDVENLYYTGCEEEIYNLAMSTGVYNEIFNGIHIDYKPTIEVTAENETKTKYTIEYIGVPIGETLICAEYQNGKLLNAKHGKLKDENVFEATNENTDEIEIFVWEDFKTAMPVCKSKSILVE